MKWFKHDADANMDAKLQEVLLDYGLEGYGLYWYCLELIVNKVSADNITFSLEHDARVIARNTGSTIARVESIMRKFIELGLFEHTGDLVTCLKLAKRIDKSMTNSKPMRDFVEKLRTSDVMTNQSNVMTKGTNVMTTSAHVMTSSDNVMIEENRIEENRIIKHSPSDDEQRSNPLEESFNEFWKLYPKKVSKAQAFKAWKRIKPTQTKKIEILAALQAQIAARANATGFVPEWKYPATWLNAESWMDELRFDGDGEISSGTDGIYL